MSGPMKRASRSPTPKWKLSTSAATRSILNGTTRSTRVRKNCSSYFCRSPYHDRFGYRQERVSGSRDRRQGEGGCEEATPAQPGDCVFQSSTAVPDRHGGLCHGALLGARVDEARPRG